MVLGLAAVLLVAALSAPASASAPSPTYAETRVWGFDLEIPAGVGVERTLSPTRTGAYGARYDELAAGYPLVPRGIPQGARFSQRTFSSTFSNEGLFAGRTVDDVAAALRSGELAPGQVPINYIVRDGNTLILNTRSAQALEAAGIPRSQWQAINQTGNQFFEDLLTGQLQRNRLTSEGIVTVRPSGGG